MSVDDCDAKIRSRQSPSAMGRYVELLKKLAEHFKVTLEYLAGTTADTLADVSAQQFFRDFKSLSEEEQAVLRQTLEIFKNRKAPGDAKN